LTRPKEDRDAT